MSEKLHLKLVLGDFAVSPKEVLLVARHGRISEEIEDPDAIRRELYRAVQQIHAKEHIQFRCHIDIGIIAADIAVSRIYHYQGEIRRVAYPQLGASNARNFQPKPHEIRLLQVAGCLAELASNPPSRPKGLSLIMHELSEYATPEDLRIQKSTLYPVPLLPLEEGKRLIANFLAVIARCASLPDESLPPCDLDERWGHQGNDYSKCRTACRVRNICHQWKQAKEDYIRIFTANNAALSHPE